MDCGNIRIEDGNITATGMGKVKFEDMETSWSNDAAAIGGCGGGDCGNITITGGTVNADGSDGAAAIGGGYYSECGNITILSGVTYVRAYHILNSPYAIGPGEGGTCGSVTIGSTTGYVTANPYVYAPKDVPYTVTFSANDGTSTAMTQGFYSNTPQALTVNTFTRTDYVFLGWNTKPDGSGKTYTDGETVNNLGNVTLYAHWHAPFYVKFDANGGMGTMADQTFVWNTPQALTANTFTRAGYDFTGWNIEADGSGTDYTDGQTISNLEDMTLYAQWQIHTYSITYRLNGGTNASGTPATYTIESNDITLAEPTRFGFIFDGWTYEGQTVPTKDVTIVKGSYGDKSFTANWTLNPIATITLETGDAVLYDGHTLTGTGGANTHVTIKNGATVTLSGVTITDIPDDGNHPWAGISCEGNATIILADGTTNTVKGGYGNFPGVTVPEGKTLTIRGSGTLIAGSKYSGAGIGAGYRHCGNIIIEGGTIIATGANGAAGIGGSPRTSCGNITITDGVTSVTATAGWGAPNSIGSGSNSTVGTVTIGGVVTGSISQRSVTYTPSDTTPYTVMFDANGGEGKMDAQSIAPHTLQALNANTFTREDYEFTGWNTAANGSGFGYRDGQTVFDLGNVTLYAQWRYLHITKTLNSSTGDIELVNGDMVSGTGGIDNHVTIADGATVTLYNVNIIGDYHYWAGITCLGDATIIVKGTNSVAAGYNSAGIFVPSGKTLTITGDGSLTATGMMGGAGIGGNRKTNCGNIVIEGGTITAVGSLYAAGIGGAYDGSCGNITITSGVTRVSATTNLSYGNQAIIGKGDLGSVGTITIAPELTDVTSGSTRTLYHSLTLVNNADNAEAINKKAGGTYPATLSGRTLYKDGEWNTLCLPFAVSSLGGTPLEGATLMELDDATSGLTAGTLTLNFTEATGIEAGKPYIVKWGTKADLLIGSASEWDEFAKSVNSGKESYEGKTVRLTNDISVTTMAGTSNHKFKGTFDGNGHKLTVTYGTADSYLTEQFAAPFRFVEGATVKNLHVAGDIYINAKFAAGLMADLAGDCTVSNCRSSVAIHSNVSGDGTHGGFLGIIHKGTTTMTNCLFDGKMLGDKTTHCGGFAGWDEAGAKLIITNSLFAPTELTISDTGSMTFSRSSNSRNVTIDDSYYTKPLGTKQSAEAPESVSVLVILLGDGWKVSGSAAVPKMTRLDDIVNPTFKEVTVSAMPAVSVNFEGARFAGSYNTCRATLVLNGDVTGDGVTNDADLTALTDYLVGKSAAPSYPDVNNDTTVDITDVTALIGILTSGQPELRVVSNVEGIGLAGLDGTR